MNKKGTGAKWIIAIVVIAMLLFFALIGFITDFLWFKELSYVSVFLTKLFTQLKMGIPSFIIIGVIAYFYMKMMKRSYFKKVESTDVPNEKLLNRAAIGISAAAGAVITFSVVTTLWWKFLQFTNSTDFNIKDPLFGNDISFYIFKLDFIKQLNETIIGAIVVFVIVTVVYYMILIATRKPQMFERQYEDPYGGYDDDSQSGSNPFGNSPFGDMFGKFEKAMGGGTNQTRKPKKQFDNENFKQLLSIASKQLIVLGIIFFLMLAVNFFLRQYELLYSSTGVLYGAGFTDVNVTLWVYRVLMVLSLVAAITFAMGISKRKFKMVLTVPVIMIILGLVGSGAAALVQNLIVAPDAISKESPYLERNIQYTQYAYGLDDVETTEFESANSLTIEDIENNLETINNIRINDYEPAEKFYNQTQAIRQYYTFSGVDVDRYVVDGEYTQVFLSAREIDETKISQEWLNMHLKYTHGYGITLSRVDKVTTSGQPDMLIDSIPPVSDIPEIEIDRPEIYFGELTNSYILVKTDEEEFDYPDGSSNVYTMYQGDAGIELNFINRLMFSIRESSLKLLVSTNVDDESRIVINRNIIDRVNEIMPYLSYDSDPYIVTVDGKLYWIIDAYTASDNYPYSKPFSDYSNANYIRNSVKVVIDAYNGTTNYYIVDETDPIAMTMKGIFPELFKTIDQMPEGIKAHLRYPNTLFKIQAEIYSRYHMEDVKVFYQGEDLWEISNEIYGITEQRM
ncbi:MAG: UPF0182 family protein, partial [Firmicutes bacterium]|nr:UPF0182 family protein [Bacillota bacterium]